MLLKKNIKEKNKGIWYELKSKMLAVFLTLLAVFHFTKTTTISFHLTEQKRFLFTSFHLLSEYDIEDVLHCTREYHRERLNQTHTFTIFHLFIMQNKTIEEEYAFLSMCLPSSFGMFGWSITKHCSALRSPELYISNTRT